VNGIGKILTVKQSWSRGKILKIMRTQLKKEKSQEPIESVEPATEVNCPVAATPNLAIREGRNRHPPAWSADYVFGEGLSEEDEANMAFLIISDPVNFEEAVKSPKWRLAMDEEIKSIEKKSNMALGGSICWCKENRGKVDL